ncbi:50S ribosomal protein L11 methyltransferase [Anaerotignum sp. MSJ-24]|uniref:50S ribosomal protein L11 methyltransferase n=1 Tax=Anaerotignum sp. MSJ-24 TaxID=2841521 RepID=UPI001C0FCA73|nr:50S ribosomal protein L11 methyltransferase [Anaerotignum sp. MSJ-24]MBU5463906.1 50S ribosomal protein L11 methyltransferase [Anaerotignum sp. MSJ-24]
MTENECNWIEIFIETTKEGFEPVSGIIYQCGITGVMIEDTDDFEEFLENPARDWDYIEDELVEQKHNAKNGITFFVRDNMNGKETFELVKEMLKNAKENEKEIDFGSLDITVKNIKEDDWANNWKKYFKPFAVGDKIVIRPSWEEYNDDGNKTVLKIDPGHVFGTGTHETTQLCIELIENYLKKDDMVLDIGCGSGILSIASLLLSAKYADAVDIDPNAIDIAYTNAGMNDIGRETYDVVSGNILEDEDLNEKYSGKKYDVVEANIVADVIIALTDKIPEYIKDGGVFISSGIIVERLDDVLEALKGHGFEVLEVKKKKGWSAIASRYNG